MTVTLSNSQADLPRLVEIASQGEDVVITVEGKPMARLTSANVPSGRNGTDLSIRLKELASLREKYVTGKSGPTVDQILEESRTDRP
jgi:prevent-host-death family protein